MTDKLKGFLERHNYKIKTMTCLKKIQNTEVFFMINLWKNKHTNDTSNYYDKNY